MTSETIKGIKRRADLAAAINLTLDEAAQAEVIRMFALCGIGPGETVTLPADVLETSLKAAFISGCQFGNQLGRVARG